MLCLLNSWRKYERVVEYMAACQLTAVEGFPGTPAPVLWSTYLGTGQVHWRREIVLLRGYLGPGFEAQLHRLDVASVHRRVEGHISLGIVKGYHLLAGAAALLAPLQDKLRD